MLLTAVLLVPPIAVSMTARHASAGTFPGRNGRIAFVGWDTRGDEIFTANGDGSGLNELTAGGSFPVLAPDWSPEGGRIAFARNYDIWVMNANGTGMTNLTETPGVSEWHPAWSPDGSRIAFTRGGAAEISVMDSDGSNVVNLGVTAEGPEWSPDGTRIAFAHAGDLFVMDATGSNVTNLTNTPDVIEKGPGWSPDGTRLVFSESAFGSNAGIAGISLMDPDGENHVHVTPTTNEDLNPTFSPDGQRIAFSNNDKISLIDPDGTDRTAIVRGLQRASEPDWQAITLSVTTDVNEVDYREQVTITANLYWADATTNPNVAIYRRPLDGIPVLVVSGPVDAAGDLSAVVTPGKRTNFYAIWSGDAGHPGTKSPEATVIVHARVTGRLLGFRAVSGVYRLYRPGVDPRYRAEVSPNHAGKRLRFFLALRKDGVWSRIATSTFRIRSDGSVTVFVNGAFLKVGLPYRIRALFDGDRDHAGDVDTWRFFRVTAGSSSPERRMETLRDVQDPVLGA